MKKKEKKEGVYIKNSSAYHNYNIQDTLEVGVVLTGTEIKSIRNAGVTLKDSYAICKNGQLLLINMHIKGYEFGNINNPDPLRTRVLLAKKSQIRKLEQMVKKEGYSLIPVAGYITHGLFKIALGYGKGKKLYDKREDLKQKDANRGIQKALKESLKYNG